MARAAVLFFLVSLSWCASARAELAGADSIEWLTCQSEVVAVGVLADWTTVKGPSDVVYEDCILRVSESIKGAAGPRIPFCYRHYLRDDTSWIRPRVELLVFLSRWKDSYPDDRIKDYKSDPYYEARMHKLLVPTVNHFPLSVIDLRNAKGRLFSTDARRLSRRTDILQIARTWAKSPINHYIDLDVPFDSDAFRMMESGSGVILKVPAEKKYRAHFMEMARSPKLFERSKGAKELWKFPGPETEAVLRKLLDDDTEYQSSYAADIIYTVVMPVRTAAYESLKTLGAAVPDLPLERKPTEEEKRHLRETYWRDSFRRALPEQWNVSAVTDGSTMSIQGQKVDFTIVIVDIKNDTYQCKLTLVPAEWPRKNLLPHAECLGIYEPSSQGSRLFFLEGEIPADVKSKLISFYRLERPSYLAAELGRKQL